MNLCAEAFVFESLVGCQSSWRWVACCFCVVDDLGPACWFGVFVLEGIVGCGSVVVVLMIDGTTGSR